MDPNQESLLADVCEALGWQGGTRHQVLAEIRRLAEADRRQRDLEEWRELEAARCGG